MSLQKMFLICLRKKDLSSHLKWGVSCKFHKVPNYQKSYVKMQYPFKISLNKAFYNIDAEEGIFKSKNGFSDWRKKFILYP